MRGGAFPACPDVMSLNPTCRGVPGCIENRCQFATPVTTHIIYEGRKINVGDPIELKSNNSCLPDLRGTLYFSGSEFGITFSEEKRPGKSWANLNPVSSEILGNYNCVTPFQTCMDVLYQYCFVRKSTSRGELEYTTKIESQSTFPNPP
jgi:hypothetical protein